MASYLEFKRLIGLLAGSRQVEFDGKDIDGVLTDSYGSQETNEEGVFLPGDLPVHVGDSELRHLYDSVMAAERHGLALRTPTSCEVSIRLARPTHFKKYEGTLEISNGDVRYKLDCPSLEYLAFLLLQLIDKYDVLNTNKWPMGWEDKDIVYSPPSGGFGLKELLPHFINALSLRIETDKPTSREEFEAYRRAISFEMMNPAYMPYLEHPYLPFVEYRDLSDFFFSFPSMPALIDFETSGLRNRRKYNRTLVDRYSEAAYFQDHYNKFLAFYHVLESLFGKFPSNGHRPYANKDGKISEREWLRFILQEYAPNVKTSIDQVDSFLSSPRVQEYNQTSMERFFCGLCGKSPRTDAQSPFIAWKREHKYQRVVYRIYNMLLRSPGVMEYYQTPMARFFCGKSPSIGAGSPFIAWGSKYECQQIANRIYRVRCALVHTKHGQPQYSQREDWAELAREIPLVRAVAEIVISNTAIT